MRLILEEMQRTHRLLDTRHAGLPRAIHVPPLARSLNPPERYTQEVLRELVFSSYPLGSLCGKDAGIFRMQTAQEFDLVIAQAEARVRSEYARLAALRRSRQFLDDPRLFDLDSLDPIRPEEMKLECLSLS